MVGARTPSEICMDAHYLDEDSNQNCSFVEKAMVQPREQHYQLLAPMDNRNARQQIQTTASIATTFVRGSGLIRHQSLATEGETTAS